MLKSRVSSLLQIPHRQLVPVFVVVSDVCGVDDGALDEVKAEIQQMLTEDIGRNKKGRMIPLIEVNSEKKTVKGHLHPVGVQSLCMVAPLPNSTTCRRYLPPLISPVFCVQVIGLKELLSEMLSALDPVDALTFTRERGVLGKFMYISRVHELTRFG